MPLGPVLCLHLPVASLGPGQWSMCLVLTIFGVLIRTRSMHVHLGNQPRSSKTTLWSWFPKFLPLRDLSDICQFPGSLRGEKDGKLSTISVLVQILVFFHSWSAPIYFSESKNSCYMYSVQVFFSCTQWESQGVVWLLHLTWNWILPHVSLSITRKETTRYLLVVYLLVVCLLIQPKRNTHHHSMVFLPPNIQPESDWAS